MKKLDLHIHTMYSPDASPSMRDYAVTALEIGAEILCYTDHIECTEICDTYSNFPFEKRAEEFNEVKREFDGRLKLLLGYEFGEPHLHLEKLRRVANTCPDMIIGSVHYPLDYNDMKLKGLNRREYEKIYNEFMLDMVSTGGFEVMGHADLPKRYHDDYVEDKEKLKQIMKLCAQKGVVPEINTSSLRKGLKETMPSLEMISYYRDCGGTFVTLNSDSHTTQTLCSYFDETAECLPDGIRLCYFENRVLVPLE